MFETWKAKFAVKANRDFERRLVKANEAIAESMGFITLWQDTEQPGWEPFQAKLDTLAGDIDEAMQLRDEGHPRRGYRKLDPIKKESRKLSKAVQGGLVDLAAPDDGTTKSLTVVDVELGSALKSRVGAVTAPYDLDALEVRLHITVELPSNVYLQIAGDPLFHQQIQDAVSEKYKSAMDRGADLYSAYQDEVEDHGAESDEAVEALEAFLEFCNRLETLLPERSKTAADKAVLAWKKVRSQYAAYKIQTGAAISLSVVSIGGSLAVMATAGLGNVFGAIVGIWQLIKAVFTLIQQLRDAAIKAHDAYENALTNVESLKESLDEVTTGREVGFQFAKFLTGIDWHGSHSRTQALVKLAFNKYHGVEVKAHELAVQLNKLLAKLDALTAVLSGVTGAKAREAVAAARKLPDVNAKVSQLLDRIPNMMADANLAREWCVGATAELDQIASDQLNKKLLLTTDIAFAVADIGLGFGSGLGPDSFKNASKTATTVLGLTNSIMAEVDNRLIATIS